MPPKTTITTETQPVTIDGVSGNVKHPETSRYGIARGMTEINAKIVLEGKGFTCVETREYGDCTQYIYRREVKS